jgi:hypothetical protein
VYVVVPPRTLLLDIAGPIEVLRWANQVQQSVRFEVSYDRSERRKLRWLGTPGRGAGARWLDRITEIIARRYDALGEAAVEPLFGDPHSHTSGAGAELNAECVAAGLKALPHDPVAAYFSAKGKAINAVR